MLCHYRLTLSSRIIIPSFEHSTSLGTLDSMEPPLTKRWVFPHLRFKFRFLRGGSPFRFYAFLRRLTPRARQEGLFISFIIDRVVCCREMHAVCSLVSPLHAYIYFVPSSLVKSSSPPPLQRASFGSLGPFSPLITSLFESRVSVFRPFVPSYLHRPSMV